MFKLKTPQREQGFTLVEVLIAILITTLFVAVSMQAMVFAAVFKARAQQTAEATTWIQEDLEKVRFEASQYKDTTECAATSADNGYADGLRDNVTGSDQSGTNTFTFPNKTFRTSKLFRMRRITTPLNTSPYNLLQINYEVSPIISSTTVGSPIAKFYTEVIPDAALQCSQ